MSESEDPFLVGSSATLDHVLETPLTGFIIVLISITVVGSLLDFFLSREPEMLVAITLIIGNPFTRLISMFSIPFKGCKLGILTLLKISTAAGKCCHRLRLPLSFQELEVALDVFSPLLKVLLP